MDYSKLSILQSDKILSGQVRDIDLTGKNLTLREIISAANGSPKISITVDSVITERLATTYKRMLDQVMQGIPIYGCNSGYGGRAGNIVNNGSTKKRLHNAKLISESIVHTDVGVGPELPVNIVRAATLIRINMLLQGVSAVKISDLELLVALLNNNITPVVNAYGGLGASGDLPQNGRLVSALRQMDHVFAYDSHGKKYSARDLLIKAGIPKLHLDPKAGLGLVNGDNFSTAAAAVLTYDTLRYLLISDVLGAMVIEVLRGSNRSFHPLLAKVRPHPGQKEVAEMYLFLLEDSKLAFRELNGHRRRKPGVIIQDAYSMRCLSQSDGFSHEYIKWALNTVELNANSVSDNPLWVPPEFATAGESPWQWISGGNFYGLHMGEVIDGLRKLMTKLIKRNDRHLHRMVYPQTNNGLPANLSDHKAISQCAFKGFQLQSGMFDVYSMILAQPVTTLFGIHEESNQDITPHSLTSAILAMENLRILEYSMSMNLIAVAQAVDLRGGPNLLSSHTRPVYEEIRKKVNYMKNERPLSHDIETVAQVIKSGELNTIIREKVFGNKYE